MSTTSFSAKSSMAASAGAVDGKILLPWLLRVQLKTRELHRRDRYAMAMTRHDVVKQLLSDRTVVISYLYAISGDIHHAEDAFQEIVLRAGDHCEQIEDGEHLRGWARRVGRSFIIDSMRLAKRRPMIFDSDVLDSLEAQWRLADRDDQTVRLEALRTCMRELNPQARQMIEMRYQQNLNGQQIADRLGRPRGSVYVSLSRVYRTLATCIRQRMSEVGDV